MLATHQVTADQIFQSRVKLIMGRSTYLLGRLEDEDQLSRVDEGVNELQKVFVAR
jgi:hypothetical protein